MSRRQNKPSFRNAPNQLYSISEIQEMTGTQIVEHMDKLKSPEEKSAFMRLLTNSQIDSYEEAIYRAAGRRYKKRSTRRKKRRGKKTH
jgi:hypothetical protein